MRALALWICLCVYLNCAGWILSALHQLNAGGYAVVLGLGVLAGLAFWKPSAAALTIPWPKLRRRFRRGFPLAFLVLAVMSLLGAVLYAPSNYDGLAYRLPRILHWLEAGQWHWIHTIFPRLNQRSCGIEWVSAPLIALLKTTRPLFLIDFISFLFLPGLVFSVFIQLGVRARVAWHWMWLTPTGYCFLLQAASIGNDLFAAFFVLAAMHYALRAKKSRNWQDFMLAVLAAAMMTSAKPSNLPLLLPWALAMLPSASLVLRWPVRVAVLATVAALASFLPTVLLNIHFCGDWSGLKVEVGSPPAGPLFLLGTNIFLLALTNFNPPVCPFSGWWHNFFPQHLPAALADKWAHTMEAGLRSFDLGQMQMEESAGIGFGICSLVVFSLLAGRLAAPRTMSQPRSLWLLAVRWSSVFSLVVLMCHSWLGALSREVTPYYAMILPLVLTQNGQAWLVQRRWWRRAGILVFALAAIPVVLSPPRPLFPAMTILNHVHNAPARIGQVYKVYRLRPDGFGPVTAVLPAGTRVLGLLTYDDPEASLWQPFGSRRIEHVRPEDTAAELKARGIKYILFRPGLTEAWFHESLDEWMQQHDAQIVQTIPLSLRASMSPQDWLLVELK